MFSDSITLLPQTGQRSVQSVRPSEQCGSARDYRQIADSTTPVVNRSRFRNARARCNSRQLTLASCDWNVELVMRSVIEWTVVDISECFPSIPTLIFSTQKSLRDWIQPYHPAAVARVTPLSTITINESFGDDWGTNHGPSRISCPEDGDPAA